MSPHAPLSLADSVVVLVDYQQRLLPLIDRADTVVAEAMRLADVARVLGVPVIGTEQNPAGLGPKLEALRRRCDVTLEKLHFDACADGLLEAVATSRSPGGSPARRDVVIAGCEAHVCLMQTTLALLRAGHRAWVVAPACGSRRASDHALGMQRLQQAGAVLVSVEMASFEWLAHCRHAHFREVLALLKAAPSPSLLASTTLPPEPAMAKPDPSTTSDFEHSLAAEGYGPPEVREIPAGTFNDRHAHPFAVKALMLEGELQLSCEGRTTTYRAGDVFTMAADCEHVEQFGPQTTRYLVGRRQAD